MKTTSDYIVVTVEESPDVREQEMEVARVAWPEFMLHDPVADYFTELYDYFPQHQFGLTDEATGELM